MCGFRNSQPHFDRSARFGFIGRQAELDELSACFADALSGHGRLFVISGESGIGKTMLVEEIAALAERRGFLVLWGRCWEGGGAPAFWPWNQALRPLIEDDRADGWGDVGCLARLVPEIRDPKRLEPSLSSPADRFRLFAAIGSVLECASAVRPLLLILDDLHAADHASLLLLRFVARDLRRQPILVVTTLRQGSVHRSGYVAEVLAELVREGPSIHLPGLGLDEVRRLMENLTDTPVSEEEASRVWDATGGNPLFIRELVRLMGTSPAPGWHTQFTISEGIREVIHQRTAVLDSDGLQVLSVAAVIGREFEAPLVADVLDMDLPTILECLGQSERLGLLVRTSSSGPALRFAHGLVREVLYDDLPIPARAELHEKVGAAIERSTSGDLIARLPELAYHYERAASRSAAAKTVEIAGRAGDQAMAAHAYEEAASLYRSALAASGISGKEEGTRCELFLRLGTACARAGDYEDAKRSFVSAAEIARQLNAPEQLARAALGFGEPQVEPGIVDNRLLSLLNEAADLLGSEDSALRAPILARIAIELTFAGEERLQERIRQDELAMARRVGNLASLALACRARWSVARGPDGLEERHALSNEILHIAGETGDPELELLGRARRMTCAFESGAILAVEADLAAHARLAGELRMPYLEWTAASVRAGLTLLNGTISDAEVLADTALELLPIREAARLAQLNQITLIRWEQDRLRELLPAWHEFVDRFPKDGYAQGWLILASCDRGPTIDARRRLLAIVEEHGRFPRGGLWLPALATASLASAQLEDSAIAQDIHELLLPYAERTIVIPMPHPVMCLGAASLYLGILATTMSRFAEAEEHFEVAIDSNARLGARAFVARTQYEFARMLIRRGRTADRSRSLALLDQADAIARSCGMLAVGSGIERTRTLTTGTAVALAEQESVTRAENLGQCVFHREGDYWTVVYDGTLIRLRDSKGLRLVAMLLRSPGREFHSIALETEIATQAQGFPGRKVPASSLDDLALRSEFGDAGALLDAQAKSEYQARLAELEVELDEAERYNDPERAAIAEQERRFLVGELARAVGLHGRNRRAGSHAERARVNVTRAIKHALSTIERHHPALGQHLRTTIRTGNYCSYSPDPRVPIRWTP